MVGQENVIIPGDPEREQESIRSKAGIPLNEKVIEDLKEIAEKLQVPF